MSDVTYNKPLPRIDDPESASFWEGLRAEKLVLQRCSKCSYVRWPPGPVCPECLSFEFTWDEMSGKGSLWSFAIYDRAFNAGFRDDVPYNVVLVELDEGPLLISNVVAADDADIAIGRRVSAHFDAVTPEVTLLKFRLD